MLVIKEKAELEISYPLDNIADKSTTMFFDIETTGFSRQYSHIYLIGCLYFVNEQPMYAQWLADNYNDEANVLMAFYKFINKFDTIIHFNGNSFDIPFIRERGLKYNIDFDFDSIKSIDIYKPLQSINHILKMPNQKQKSFEKILGINRQDTFNGGELIEVFKHYVESKDSRLIYPLLLHNKEDVINMASLLSLLSVSDLFDNQYAIKDYAFEEYKTMDQNI